MTYKLDFAFFVPGLPFDGTTLKEKGLGGSETAGAYVARELVKRGHRVTVFSNGPRLGKHDGVEYRNASDFEAYSRFSPHDVTVVQRIPDPFHHPLASKLNILWCHDLPLKRSLPGIGSRLWNIDGVFCVSEWMAKRYQDVYQILPETTFATRNGIDLELINEIAPDEAQLDRKRILYLSRPERGLDVLLRDVMPRLLEKVPDAHLTVATYDNPVEQLAEFYKELEAHAQKLPQGKVVLAGALSKPDLYKLMKSSGLLLYPGPSQIMPRFAEVSCIGAMEAMACGLPIVAAANGALPETTKGAATLIEGKPWEADIAQRYADEAARLLTDDQAWRSQQAKGLALAHSLDWSGVAEQWEQWCISKLAECNDSPQRLARHFYRHSDIEACAKVFEKHPGCDPELQDMIARNYVFTRTDEAFASHYAALGADTDIWLGEQEKNGLLSPERMRDNTQPRFKAVEHAIRDFIAEEAKEGREVKTVYDHGCGHGWMPMAMAPKFPELEFSGWDLDGSARMWATLFSKDRLKYGGSVQVLDAMPGEMRFDCAICSEVLEHVRDLDGELVRLENTVKPGGCVVLTVPYGPTEYWTYNWQRFRNHIRELDIHDLREMFKDKPGFRLIAVTEGAHADTGDPLGFWVAIYRADHKPCGKIDWERKLALQRPRETLAANIIAGPNSERMLEWTLDSVQPITDEIVIADCGMTAKARRIAIEHGAKLVQAHSPLRTGFEVARNTALAATVMDWVFWIDTDEIAVNPSYFTRFLRRNTMDGYSVKQHHFTCEGQIPADIPVRVFRRVDKDGVARIKFYGAIHEHPEREMNKGPGRVLIVGEIGVAHVGYLTENIRRDRFKRNYPLLLEDERRYPDRLLQKYMRMRDNIQLAQSELSGNGGKVTAQIRELCKKTAALYREHFLGKSCYVGLDPNAYYSAALNIMGEGFDIVGAFDVARPGQRELQANALQRRYLNLDEFKADFWKTVEDKFEPIAGEDW